MFFKDNINATTSIDVEEPAFELVRVDHSSDSTYMESREGSTSTMGGNSSSLHSSFL